MFVNPCHCLLSWLLVPILSCHHLSHRQIKCCIEEVWLCWCRQRFYKFRRCRWSDMGVGRVVGPCGICPISEAGFHARRSQITHNYRCRHSPARNSKGEAATNRSHLRDQRYQHNRRYLETCYRTTRRTQQPRARNTGLSLPIASLPLLFYRRPPQPPSTQCYIIQVAPPQNPFVLHPASLSNVTVPLLFSLCGALLAT